MQELHRDDVEQLFVSIHHLRLTTEPKMQLDFPVATTLVGKCWTTDSLCDLTTVTLSTF